MSIGAATYFQHLRAYVNSDYIMHDGAGGKIVLKETYFRPEDAKPKERKIELLLSGLGMAFKLDQDDFEQSKGKTKPALLHFLNDVANPWSRQCDFVIFYVVSRKFRADCIEFKSKSLTADKIVPQLRAGVCWVSSLKRTIENYTGDRRPIRLRRLVFAENTQPQAYLDGNRQLIADPSIRYYHFDEVQEQSLANLQNLSFQEI